MESLRPTQTVQLQHLRQGQPNAAWGPLDSRSYSQYPLPVPANQQETGQQDKARKTYERKANEGDLLTRQNIFHPISRTGIFLKNISFHLFAVGLIAGQEIRVGEICD